MSIMLTVEFDRKLEEPEWIAGWFCQVLPELIIEYSGGAGAVPDVIGKLARHFELNIDPLAKLGGQQFSREEFPSDEIFARYQAQNEAAWQPPDELIECIRVFTEKIESDPEVFSRLKIDDPAFWLGGLKADLRDLRRVAEWAKENGVQKLRMSAA